MGGGGSAVAGEGARATSLGLVFGVFGALRLEIRWFSAHDPIPLFVAHFGGMFSAEVVGGCGILAEDNHNVAVAGQIVKIKLFEIVEWRVVPKEFVQVVQRGIDELQFEPVEGIVRLFAGEFGDFSKE